MSDSFKEMSELAHKLVDDKLALTHKVIDLETELKELKDGIRNLKTYNLESCVDGDSEMEEQANFSSNSSRGDYVEAEDLEKLLKGDK